MDIIGRDVCPREFPRVDLRENCIFVADHRQVVCVADLAVRFLHTGAVFLCGKEQNHRWLTLRLEQFPHQTVVAFEVAHFIGIVDGKLYHNHIRVLCDDILIHTMYTDIGIRRADSCVDKVKLCRRNIGEPPLQHALGVAFLAGGGRTALSEFQVK